MYGPNKNKQEVKNVSGKILAAGGNVKITWNDDSTFNVIMYHPTYFKQGHLIRLVGRGDELTEFAPPSSDRGDGGGGDDRSRRIRKLLEIAIQVAKQKNVDELGMIHAMNMIAGDEFFSVAVEGILPDITDKEYMFVLQSAYKTVKQGLAETINSSILNKKFKHKQVIGDYTYTATSEDFEGSPLLWIKAYDGKKEIGHILFEIIVRSPGGKRKASADYLESGGTEVDPAYRDKGVASTMYAYAKMLGNDIQASYNQTSQGKAMWKAWEKAGDAKHLIGTSMESTVSEDLNEGPFVKRIVHPNKINIYVRQGNKKSPLLVATDIPYKIFDKYVNKAIQKYPQFKQTDFSFKSSDKINEFVTPSGGDDREPDEEILRKLAAMWWNGSIQQMKKAQQTLHSMGWDIGKDESGDDDAGVFVIRIGDEDGDSYIAFNHSDLDLNEDYLDEN
jgi:GNAT superfamily N-acetyltransferase